MFVSTSSSPATKVPLGEGLPLKTLFKNTIGVDGFGSRRRQYLERKLTIPVAFFETGKNYREIYVEAIRAYLFGLPNASIAIISKCVQVAMKKRLALNGVDQLTFKKGDAKKEVPLKEDTTLNNLIESQEGTSILKNIKEETVYLRLLRNHLHDDLIVDNNYASEALGHMQRIITTLFPNPVEVFIQYACTCCGKRHVGRVSSGDYFPNSRMFFRCINPPKREASDNSPLLEFTPVTINI